MSGLRVWQFEAPATFRAIRDDAFLTHVAARTDCDTFILYWAGHGVSTRRKGRVLFFADSSERAQDCLSLDNVLDFLDVATHQFDRQFGFVDACALPWDERALLPQKLLQTDNTDYVRASLDRQFYFAAGIGKEAFYPDPHAPGLFTQILVAALDRSSADANTLSTELSKSFALDKKGRAAYLKILIGSERNWSHYGDSDRTETHAVFLDGYRLEAEALKLSEGIVAEDQRWFAVASRLYPLLNRTDPSRTGVIRSMAGLSDRSKAALYLTALLLRVGAIAQAGETRASILTSGFSRQLVDAEALITRVFDFAQPCYSMILDLGEDGNCVARAVWFYSMSGLTGERITPLSHAETVEATLDGAITDHLLRNNISADILIELVAPLQTLIDPPDSARRIEDVYSLVYRWRDRTEGSGEWRRLLPFIRDCGRSIKARTAAGRIIAEWFNADQQTEEIRARLRADALSPLDFPAFRTGGLPKADQRERIRQLLRSGAPFAALTRCSIGELNPVDESELVRCTNGAKKIADVPCLIQRYTKKGCPLFSHVSVLWDDFDRNPFIKYE